MSIWRRPRERIGEIGESVDDGMVRADELLEFALPAVWGERFTTAAMRLLPVGILETDHLRNAFDNGRNIGVAYPFHDALRGGSLVARVSNRKPDGKYQRIPVADWEAASLDEILYLLRTGSGYPLRRELPVFAESPIVLFTEHEAEEWLDGIPCLTRLPDPRVLDDERLPRDFVTLTQGVSWLTGQHAGDFYGYAVLAAGLREAAMELDRLPDPESWGQEYDALCHQFAKELAQSSLRNQAALRVLNACGDGRLQAYGVVDEMLGKLQKIDKSAFLTKKEFLYFEDMLIAGESESYVETRLAQASGQWKHVRFRRDEFLEALLDRSADANRMPQQDSAFWKGGDQATENAHHGTDEMPLHRPELRAAEEWANQIREDWRQGDPKLGREDTIGHLMSEFSLPRPKARKMWASLPEEMRRKRGNPGKS